MKKEKAEEAKNQGFTATEVGVLVERLETKIDVIGERVSGLCEDMIEVKGRLTTIEGEVTSIRVSVLPRISRLEAKVGL